MGIYKNRHGLPILDKHVYCSVSQCFAYVLVFNMLLFPMCGYAWNAVGHRVIAQIALNNLTPEAKLRFKAFNRLLNNKKHTYTLVDAAVWLDTVRDRNTSYSGSMHYIDIPFSRDNTPLPPIESVNAVVAFQKARAVLLNPYYKKRGRAVALRVVLHLVGDLHQPLHAATLVSKAYPLGDYGGNLTRLPKNPISSRLHSYWDQGAGLWALSMNRHEIKQYAAKIEAHWPCDTKKMQQIPWVWAKESHTLAITYAYAFPNTTPLDAIYQRAASQIVEERVALAGCRLAAVLNDIDASTFIERSHRSR